MHSIFKFDLKFQGFDNVVLCKNSPRDTSVFHYFTQGKFRPGPLDPGNPSVGISNSKVAKNNEYFLCSFNREKISPNVENYYDLNKKFHLLAATGALSDDGEIFQHDFKIPSENPIDFATQLTSNTVNKTYPHPTKVRTHGKP